MSYGCTLSFKKLAPHEIQPFFTAFKKEIIDHLDDIAEANYTFSPCFNNSMPFEKIEFKGEMKKEMEAWAAKSLRYQFYFEANGTLLCVFGVPDCTRNLFDATIYFQDSCNQNYDFDRWNGVPEFEEIAKRWQECGDDIVQKKMDEKDYEPDTKYDYYRKTFCYEAIFDNYVRRYLFNETVCLYLSLFGFYEFHEVQRYCCLCIKHMNLFNEKGMDN